MSKLSKSVHRLLLSAFVVLVAGCVTTTTAPVVVIPNTIEISKAPEHALKVAAALILKARGASDESVAQRVGVTGSSVMEPEPGFAYAGFKGRDLKFLNIAAVKGQAGSFVASGYADFEDSAGRQASAFFGAEYSLAGASITLKEAMWDPVFPYFPITETFVVPTAVVEGAPDSTLGNYRDFHSLVVANALPMKDPNAVPKNKTDYAIVVFVNDRLAADAKVDIRVGVSKSGKGAEEETIGYRVYDNGWVVGGITATFALTAADAFWVRALYTPGADADKDQKVQRVIGLFNTAPLASAEKGQHPASVINQAKFPKVATAGAKG
jgi:hypothetical protein